MMDLLGSEHATKKGDGCEKNISKAKESNRLAALLNHGFFERI